MPDNQNSIEKAISMKVKDLVDLKGCYSAYDVGELEVKEEAINQALEAKDKEMSQCPYSEATTCVMDEPCLGCETYSQWLRKREDIQ